MRRALLCACSEYSDSAFAPLKYPLSDADQVDQLLADADLCGFDEVEILKNPSKSEAHEAIERLTADSSSSDLILFYFSGHGKLARDGSVGLVLSDTKENRLLSTGLMDDQLRQMFNSSRARQRVMILDCCHSGAAGEEGFKRGAGDAVEAMVQQMKGMFVLTASTKFEPALETGEAKGSAFTACLVEGVRTGVAADKGADSISLSKLGEYLCREVPLRSTQQPKFWDFGGVGGVAIARVPRQFGSEWTETTLRRLEQMLAKQQIDDLLFVELQQMLRGRSGPVGPDRLGLIDDLTQRRIKPVAFLRRWQDLAEQPAPLAGAPSPPPDPAQPSAPPSTQEPPGSHVEAALDPQVEARAAPPPKPRPGKSSLGTGIGAMLLGMLLMNAPWDPSFQLLGLVALLAAWVLLWIPASAGARLALGLGGLLAVWMTFATPFGLAFSLIIFAAILLTSAWRARNGASMEAGGGA